MFDFWSKFRFLAKIWFLVKIWIFGENLDFWMFIFHTKPWLLTNILIFWIFNIFGTIWWNIRFSIKYSGAMFDQTFVFFFKFNLDQGFNKGFFAGFYFILNSEQTFFCILFSSSLVKAIRFRHFVLCTDFTYQIIYLFLFFGYKISIFSQNFDFRQNFVFWPKYLFFRVFLWTFFSYLVFCLIF
mgnify:CR=1 FL=1